MWIQLNVKLLKQYIYSDSTIHVYLQYDKFPPHEIPVIIRAVGQIRQGRRRRVYLRGSRRRRNRDEAVQGMANPAALPREKVKITSVIRIYASNVIAYSRHPRDIIARFGFKDVLYDTDGRLVAIIECLVDFDICRDVPK